MTVAIKRKITKNPGLKKEVLKQIKNNTQIVADLIRASKRSYPTVMRWLDDNSELLTTAKCLNVICAALKISQEEALFK